jgi:uroporphyrinogen decarboxylase
MSRPASTPRPESIAGAVADPGALRAYLEARYGRPEASTLSPWQRVEEAIAHRQPDRVPFDFWAVPEVWARLRAALACDDETVLRLLGVDCRMVTARYVGSKARTLPDGSFVDAWGTHRRRVAHRFGTYDEYASHPLAGAETVADVLSWDWASPD